MTRITWMKTHVPIRNGEKGINSSFMEPDYQMVLKDRIITISRKGAIVTNTGLENVVEFTAEETSVEQETSKKARSRAS